MQPTQPTPPMQALASRAGRWPPAPRPAALAVLLMLPVATAGIGCAPPAAEVVDFGANPGALRMYEQPPPDDGEAHPVVLSLHGCTQSVRATADFGVLELAEEVGAGVIVPSSSRPTTGAAASTGLSPTTSTAPRARHPPS